MSNLINYAKEELQEAGLFDKDSDYGGKLGEAVMELIEVFSKQEHSGYSAGIVRQLFNKLSDFKHINPISFDDKFWCEVNAGVFQHKKKYTIFKDGNGKPYNSEAFVKVAKFPDGHTSAWSGRLMLENNKFVGTCYIKDANNTPTIRIMLDVVSTGEKTSDWDFVPCKIEQLEELKKYYDFEIIEK